MLQYQPLLFLLCLLMPYRRLTEVLLLTLVIFAVPLRKYWTKFCVIDTLRIMMSVQYYNGCNPKEELAG